MSQAWKPLNFIKHLRHWSQTGATWRALPYVYQRISPYDLTYEEVDKEDLWSFLNLPRVLISQSLEIPVRGESISLACRVGTVCSELFNELLPVCFWLSAHRLWFSYTQNQSFCRPAGWLQWFAVVGFFVGFFFVSEGGFILEAKGRVAKQLPELMDRRQLQERPEMFHCSLVV